MLVARQRRERAQPSHAAQRLGDLSVGRCQQLRAQPRVDRPADALGRQLAIPGRQRVAGVLSRHARRRQAPSERGQLKSGQAAQVALDARERDRVVARRLLDQLADASDAVAG